MNATNSTLLDASCRVALSGFLHDIGKFAERARIPEAEERDREGHSRREIHIQLVCPNSQGRSTHIHAAYTAIALDLLERHLPDLVGESMTPFAPWRDKNADDSMINAAAKHHRPDTYLQWIIATADRVASGFEREEFEKYNAADDETAEKKNHYTARQITLLEQIDLQATDNKPGPLAFRYPLKPLSPSSLFPVEAKGYETDDTPAAQAEYRALWQQFVEGLEKIPASHRRQLSLWLDHFDSLWQTFSHTIPAATAFNVKPEVSLYDHSKTTAALATALWRYHHERQDNPELAAKAMRGREDWNEPKLLLIQGDFFGIQDFIFASGEATQKRAAKLLRGRSFYVSLLGECAALKVLDTLSLPALSQVTNAAGRFLIVAPHTVETIRLLHAVQRELNDWFLTHTFGQSGVGLAWLPASCNDFLKGDRNTSPFRQLMNRLFDRLETAKLRRFGLCEDRAQSPLFAGFLDAFDNTKGVCAIDGRSPATVALDTEVPEARLWVSALASDQMKLGNYLATCDRMAITRQPLGQNTLRLPVFDYHIKFSRAGEHTREFDDPETQGHLLRCWDFSLPLAEDTPLWNGYARRYINGFVPRFGEMNAWERSKYEGMDEGIGEPAEIKTLNHLACDAKWQDEQGQWVGVEALMTLKGDVDNLGLLFQRGLASPSFAKMASLSRQMNAFFTIYLPWLCRKEFPNTYTVFAGGDDVFLIGPWHSMIQLAQRMHTEFTRYVANPQIHFSTGLSMTKPGLPIRHLARMAEHALEKAKQHNPKNTLPLPKNAVSCYGIPVFWEEFLTLLTREEGITRLAKELKLSTGYLYNLLHLTEMAANRDRKPQNALWHSRFVYRTRRLLEARRQLSEERRRALQQELAYEIANLGIEKHGEQYKITLFTHLYQQRD